MYKENYLTKEKSNQMLDYVTSGAEVFQVEMENTIAVDRQTLSRESAFPFLRRIDTTMASIAFVVNFFSVDVLKGEQTRVHRDVDIDFDSQYTEQLLRVLKENGYEVVVDCSPVRIELHHPNLGYIDIHPFILLDNGQAKQADLEGGYWEFEADYFGKATFDKRTIPCISAKRQKVFHTGYELREIDKHDIEIIESLPHGLTGRIFTTLQNVGNFKSYNYIAKNMETNDTVLDIGFGNGKLMYEIASKNKAKAVYGIDISEDMLAYVNKKYSKQKQD